MGLDGGNLFERESESWARCLSLRTPMRDGVGDVSLNITARDGARAWCTCTGGTSVSYSHMLVPPPFASGCAAIVRRVTHVTRAYRWRIN